MKVLYVVMTDTWYMVCTNEPPRRRVVAVPLTPEQERLIEPKCVGKGSGEEHFEEVAPVSIQEEDGDE